jgi:hypothetical protein
MNDYSYTPTNGREWNVIFRIILHENSCIKLKILLF